VRRLGEGTLRKSRAWVAGTHERDCDRKPHQALHSNSSPDAAGYGRPIAIPVRTRSRTGNTLAHFAARVRLVDGREGQPTSWQNRQDMGNNAHDRGRRTWALVASVTTLALSRVASRGRRSTSGRCIHQHPPSASFAAELARLREVEARVGWAPFAQPSTPSDAGGGADLDQQHRRVPKDFLGLSSRPQHSRAFQS
jgi:hypothetical protein